MSDEETDNEGTGFTVHELSWRSNLLNRLLSRLDKRYDEHRKKSTLRTKAREIRILGEYSTRSKPFGAPKWTFQEQSSPTETGSLTESPMLQQSPGSSRDSATPIAHLVHSNLSTPSGSMSHALNPTQLFNGSEVDESDASDDELETLIRAATMKL